MASNGGLLPRHNGDNAGAFTHYCAIYALWVQLHQDQLPPELAREIAQRHGVVHEPREQAGRQQPVAAAAADPPARSVARRKSSKALKGGHTCFKCGVQGTAQWRTMQEGDEAKYVCNKCGLRNERDRRQQAQPDRA